MMNVHTCDDVRSEGIAESYLLDRLNEDEKAAFELHFFECSDCLEELEMMRALQAELAGEPSHADGADVSEAPVVALRTRRPRVTGLRLIYAAAAALAFFIGLQLVMSRTAPTQDPAAAGPVFDATEVRTVGPGDSLALSAPSDGAVVDPAAMDVEWNVVPNAIFYRVTATTTAGDILWQSTVSETHVSVPPDTPLAPGDRYFIWVEAQLRGGGSVTSPIVGFEWGTATEEESRSK